MNTTISINQINRDLLNAVHPGHKESTLRFFKEPINVYGVRLPDVRKLAAQYTKQMRATALSDAWHLSEQLLRTDYMEDATIALALVYARKKEWAMSDFNTLEQWLNSYVSNWALCDDICTHAMGHCITTFPEILPRIHAWVGSENRWVRRAAAVSFILPARRGNNLADVLHVAQKLLHDTDNLVQKGCGWMLREAAKKHEKTIIDYLETHKHAMPRTMLRYAIERMPVTIKQQLMHQ